MGRAYKVSTDWYDIKNGFQSSINDMVNDGWIYPTPSNRKNKSHINVEDAILQELSKRPIEVRDISKGNFTDTVLNNPELRKIFEEDTTWEIKDIIKADMSGIPDILWWRFDETLTNRWGFIEVKSKNDSLRRSQVKWISKFANEIDNINLVYVEIENMKKINP